MRPANSIRHALFVLAGYLAASCLAALFGGYFTAAATITTFYAGLAKPVWAPPGWVFGPVWTALYICMSLAMWLVWRKQRLRPVRAYARAHALWWGQLALNAAWPVIFWWRPAGFAAFAACGVLAMCVGACLVRFWPISRLAGLFMTPYVVWVSFATVLSGALWHMNRAG